MVSYIYVVLIFILILRTSNAHDDNLTRVESEVDESSCICGLNKEILDRLELLLHLGASVCLSNQQANQFLNSESTAKQTDENNQITATRDPSENGIKKPVVVSEAKPDDSNVVSSAIVTGTDSESNKTSPSSAKPQTQDETNESERPIKPEPFSLQIEPIKTETINLTPKPEYVLKEEKTNEQLLISYVLKLSTEVSSLQSQLSAIMSHPLKNQTLLLDPSSPNASQIGSTAPYNALSQESSQQTIPDTQLVTNQSDTLNIIMQNLNDEKEELLESSGREGPLSQLLANLTNPSNNGALLKLNQSQKVEPQVMETALQSAVPNLVSNILTDINKLEASQDGKFNNQSKESDQSGKLTSLDGSTVVIQKGELSEQITSSGEKLFLKWVENQLETLHLTASVANHIRKNALMLFRRIVKQYVKRMEKLGGSVTDNVRKATQMALENSQTLTSFLLKNYINFAGGLMQIIGEQVSRVGKQLDSTGTTISHVSLNPFDIVSNVLDSLPNPIEYSSYFRAFGKQLIGETENNSSTPATEPDGVEQTNEHKLENNSQKHVEQPSKQIQKPQNLITKTMGALSKLFG